MLPTEERLVGAQLDRYISNKLFWVLHAPRQTGKTTFLLNWMRELNASETVIACYVTVENSQEVSEPERAIPAIVWRAVDAAEMQTGIRPPLPPSDTPPLEMLSKLLRDWAACVAPKPLVVLFDEVDVLKDQAMVSFLRQLRSGFPDRGVGKFPISIALVGMRDLRDYLVKSKDGVPINPGSPFNIKEDSASLANFSREDVHRLIGQHIAEKGQVFETAAIDLIYDLTRGQPWLTNALAKKCVWNLVPEETKATVTTEHIAKAKELLIQEKAVHLDSLGERLKEDRVKHVIESILVGNIDPRMAEGDDFRLCLDLGLVTVERGTPQIANPIYREVIPRVLTTGMQLAIPEPEFRWQKSDGTLDMPNLLKHFQAFWRRHSETWEEKADYTEAFPHLLLMSFLQRITNGDGRIEREYAAGRGRVDLAIEFGGHWSIIEIKLVHPHDSRQTTIAEGLEKAAAYRDRLPTAIFPAGSVPANARIDAWLVVFDRRPEARAKSWEERLTWEVLPSPAGGDPITVVGG